MPTEAAEGLLGVVGSKGPHSPDSEFSLLWRDLTLVVSGGSLKGKTVHMLGSPRGETSHPRPPNSMTVETGLGDLDKSKYFTNENIYHRVLGLGVSVCEKGGHLENQNPY